MGAAAPKPPHAIHPHSKLWCILAFSHETCAQRGAQPYSSCDADHQASIRLAQKLGFRRASAYRIYAYGSLQ